MIKCIIFGCGYWGQKIISNLQRIDNVKIVGICDINKNISEKYPEIAYFKSYEDVNIEYDCSFIITRINSHFNLAQKCLENRKHVFLEKPMTESYNDAKNIIKLAKKTGKILCVDHTFVFSHEIEYFKSIFDQNCNLLELKRVNNGPRVNDLNVIFDLCPHDFSILDYIVPYKIHGVSANGISIKSGVAEKATVTVYYKNTNFKANIEVSWLETDKLRRIRLLKNNLDNFVYDNNDDFISFCNLDAKESKKIPVERKESLFAELKHFVDCVNNDKISDRIDGQRGADIVKLLEITNESIRNNGKFIQLK
jgi:predicted dehydrogenase